MEEKNEGVCDVCGAYGPVGMGCDACSTGTFCDLNAGVKEDVIDDDPDTYSLEDLKESEKDDDDLPSE